MFDQAGHRRVVEAAPESPPGAVRAPLDWTALLHRVRGLMRADDVVALDGEGLVVGHAGGLPAESVDSIAAHIGRAFDLLDGLHSIGGKAESVCVMYSPEGTWLTATRFSTPSGGRVTLGLIGPYTLARQDRMRLRNAFYRLFEKKVLEGKL
jgi:hypothetical protein